MKSNIVKCLLGLALMLAPAILTAQSTTPVDLPYQNSFEQYPTQSYVYNPPSDWTVAASWGLDYGGFILGPFPAVLGQDAHTGSQSLGFYAYGDEDNFISSPILNHGANGLQVSFWAGLDDNVTLQAGVITDPTDTTTFVPILTTSTSTSENYVEFTFTTEGLDIDGNVAIAFRVSTSDAGNMHYVLLDDLSVSASTSCNAPEAPTVSGVGYHTATFSWSGTSTDGFVLRYSASGLLGGDDLVSVTTTDTFVVVNNLEQGTVYYAWVATLCGEELTSYAAFMPFSTDTACYPLASAEVGSVSATSAVINWSYVENGEPHTGVGITLLDLSDSAALPVVSEADGISTFLTGLTEGHLYRVELRTLCDTFSANPLVLFIIPYGAPCAQSGPDNAGLVSLALPIHTSFERAFSLLLYKADELGGLNEINAIALRTSNTTAYTARMNIWLGNTADTVVADTVVHDSLTLVASNVEMQPTNSGWQIILLDSTFSYTPESNLYVLIENDTTAVADGYFLNNIWWHVHNTNYAACHGGYGDDTLLLNTGTSNQLPDIRFYGECAGITCEAPMAAITSISSEEIAVAWLDELNGNFLPQIRPVGDTAWRSLLTTTSHSAVFDSLTPATRYEVRVGTLCYDGDTLFCPTLTVWTECVSADIPADYSFNHQIDHCWTVAPGLTVSSPGINGFVRLETSYGTYENWMVTPELNASLDTLQLEILGNDYWSRDSVLSIGACNADGSDVEWIATINFPHSMWTTLIVRLDSYTGNKHHIILRSGNLRLRRVTINPLDPCAGLEELVIDTVTDASATLSWSDVNAAGSYQVQYRVVDDSTAAWTTLTSDTTTVELTSLVPGTDYDFRVRAICSPTDTSIWSTTVLRTQCVAVTEFPYTEGFEDGGDRCWTVLDRNSTQVDNWKLADDIVHSGNYSMFSRHSANHTSNEWLISPIIDLPAEGTMMLTWWGMNHANGPYHSNYEVVVSADASMSPESFDDGVLASVDFENNWTEHTVSLAAYAGMTIRIAFHQIGFYANGAYIDDISIDVPVQQPCAVPTNVSATLVTDHVVRIDWQPADTNQSHTWEVLIASNSGYSEIFEATTASYTVSGLYPNVDYSIQVRTVCDEFSLSDWSDSITFRYSDSTGIHSAAASNVALYPNPASSTVTIEAAEASTVTLLDVSGREVLRTTMHSTLTTFNVADLPRGSYFVRITGTHGTAVRKLTIK